MQGPRIKPALDEMQRLIEIMATLRSENGCQWDRKQSPESLKPYVLEECYELLEAIDSGQPEEICDELGDLLLQVVFQAQIFSERGAFTIDDAAKAIAQKLIRRHPHIFAAETYQGHEQRWEKIKLQERTERGKSNHLADRIPSSLPALKRATKLSKKLVRAESSVNFLQAEQQLLGFHEIIDNPLISSENCQQKLGELLFSIARLADSLGLDAEDALRTTTTKKIAEIDARNEAT